MKCTATITVYDPFPAGTFSMLYACERHSGHTGKHVARLGGNAIHAVTSFNQSYYSGNKAYYSIAKVTWL